MSGDRFKFDGRTVTYQPRRQRPLQAGDYDDSFRKSKGTTGEDIRAMDRELLRRCSPEERAELKAIADQVVPCEGCEHDMVYPAVAQFARWVTERQAKAKNWPPIDPPRHHCGPADACGCDCLAHFEGRTPRRRR